MGCCASKDGDGGTHSNVEKQCLADICYVREVTDEDVHDVYDFTGPVLGSGAFATVVMVKSKMSGTEYAVKQIDISEAKSNPSTMRMLENEIEGMKVLNHPNIVRLQEVYRPKDRDMLYLVLDRLSGGSVESLRKQEGRIEEGHAAYIMAQVVDAVRYCHDLNIAHRDLKLSNCMFADKSETPMVKVIDFGLCAKFKDGQTSSAFVGTKTYVAPEVIMKNKTHRLECDMWAVGVMTYTLVGGSLPFYSPNEAVLEIQIKYKKHAYPEEVWKGVSENCRDFIDKCLTKKPRKRITATQAQIHPWVKEAGMVMATEEAKKPLSKSAMLSMMRFQETSIFEKIAMELIAYSYDSSNIQDLERHFREMDTDGSGTVTLDEFKRTMEERKKAIAARNKQQHYGTADGQAESKAPPLVPVREMETAVNSFSRLDEAGIESVFEAIDVERCGCISINDFIAACLAKKQINLNHIRAAFERLDNGMKGLITPEDVIKYLGDSYPESSIAQDMRQISSREDGLVTLDDFIKCVKEYMLKSNVSSAPSSKRTTFDSSAGRETTKGLAPKEHSVSSVDSEEM